MMMKYHKIRGIPLDVCTAEQKIAYNLAFEISINGEQKYKEARKISAICADELLHDLIKWKFDSWMRLYGGKYNDDAIYACLLAGLAEYLIKPFIATEYQSIGKAFPAYYLK